MSKEHQPYELQPEQTAAAYEIDRHISVTAGPGSGKTLVLVERYLHILRERSLSIDQIVAITFTNRAANEMRERLRERLNQILQTVSGSERPRWLDYKRTLDGAVITTIHGFCARLLREFPVQARVDPEFLLLDEHRSAMLLESVVEEALTEFLSSRHDEIISQLTLGLGRSKLAAGLVHLYKEIRGQGISIDEILNKTNISHSSSESYYEALAQVDKSMGEFIRFGRLSATAEKKRAHAESEWPNLRLLLDADQPPLADFCTAIERFRSSARLAKNSAAGHIMLRLDEELWGDDKAGPLGRVPQICFDLAARVYAVEMLKLLRYIGQQFEAEKQKLSALDFDDLELRALELLERPEVLTHAGERYRFFLVDEFQDTNGLQRRLLERLALPKGIGQRANLFIVGDRKQSIYGFRGADVDVFREMTGTLIAAGGESKPLLLNFRSQPPLVNFFNYLFARLFRPQEDVTIQDLAELGYVEHEPSEAKRELSDDGPLVELMITTETSGDDDDPKAEQTSRGLDAQQLTLRIVSLTGGPASSPMGGAGDRTERKQERSPKYSDIAVLFRAMTQVQTYESVFRRANIPYQTVLGRGFYDREEITDLIQLLRFLDNRTDELALAAVLRSPLGGISDNALLALRCAPWLDEVETGDPLRHFSQTRRLVTALNRHREIAYIDDEEHELLDRADDLIKGLIARRHHYAIGSLLRSAVDESEYLTVIAATFDGAQRLANVERLFTLAERFEGSGAHLIRDFVRYVEEFEAIGSRESEGQIDEATDAVRLMSIHQAKGLQFPIVIIPDLQRLSKLPENWFLLDRHRGLTLKVPDGRGKLVAGFTFNSFEQRQAWREQFEAMRLLYVAATRAQDRLILSGTTKDLDRLNVKSDTWLKWIWQSLEVLTQRESGMVDLAGEAQLQLTLNLADGPQTWGVEALVPTSKDSASPHIAETEPSGPHGGSVEKVVDPRGAEEVVDSLSDAFPLLQAIEPESGRAIHRFSVTQLINHQRCPRQYYFDRVLHAPASDAIAVWNDAEAPEPPANLTATLKGAVIHRFCETFLVGDEPGERLLRSFKEVTAVRQAQLTERLLDIDTDRAIKELIPLAENYLSGPVFRRIEAARGESLASAVSAPGRETGLWSELPFRLRRPLGILTGAIDKLLITRSGEGDGIDIEIIDFKTHRLALPGSSLAVPEGQGSSSAPSKKSDQPGDLNKSRGRKSLGRKSLRETQQIAFDFSAAVAIQDAADESEAGQAVLEFDAKIERVALDYQLQMQAYALAVRELMPSVPNIQRVKATLHFLYPNVEFRLRDELLDPAACERAIDDAMREIVSARGPEQFPVRPATHCRMCNFLELCYAGRQLVSTTAR